MRFLSSRSPWSWEAFRLQYHSNLVMWFVFCQSNSPAAMAATVEAMPGDRVEINNSGIYVNGVAVAGLSPEFTQNVEVSESLTVPEGHYFLVGESRSGASVSRYWALIPEDHIEPAG